jgi:hypothetical protein
MTQSKLGTEEARELLERRANVARSRLLRTVDELDDRRHRLAENVSAFERSVKHYAPLVGAAAAAITGFAAVVFIVRRRRQPQGALARARLLLAPPPESSVVSDALKKAALGIGLSLAKRATVRVLQRLQEPPPPVSTMDADFRPL